MRGTIATSMPALQLIFTLLVALPVETVPNPRSSGSWVSDTAGVFSPAAVARIDARLDALERDLGVEIAVATVNGIDTTPKEFATGLFAHWGIGKARADNGLLVLLVMDQRRLEMETGYGLEPILPDGLARGHAERGHGARVQAWRFRGRHRGRSRTRRRPASHAGRGGARGDAQRPRGARGIIRAGTGTLAAVGGGIGVIGLSGAGLLMRARRRRRERTCDTCKLEMRLLDEVEDDKHLEPGQRTEEAVGSVNHLVYICAGCQFSRTVARARWFSGHSRCSSCRYKTLTTQSHTIVHATYDHGGQVLVTEECRHCGHSRGGTPATRPG